MKRLFILVPLLLLLCGCGKNTGYSPIAATTLPVYEFTSRLCEGTSLTVIRLVTEEISCLHDYSLNVRQVKAAEAAEVIVISGAGLEEFLDDMLQDKQAIDASAGVKLIVPEEHHHDHSHEAEEEKQDHEGAGADQPFLCRDPGAAHYLRHGGADEHGHQLHIPQDQLYF